jgi:hypothetical protein
LLPEPHLDLSATDGLGAPEPLSQVGAMVATEPAVDHERDSYPDQECDDDHRDEHPVTIRPKRTESAPDFG